MTIQRDMLALHQKIREQGSRVKRWKLTETQARALAINMHYYRKMLNGQARFFDIPIKVFKR